MRKLILSLGLLCIMCVPAFAAEVDILQSPVWGQSQAEIMRRFPAATQSDDDRLDFYAGKGYGGEVTISYFFMEDRLMYARYNVEAFETEEFIVPQGYTDLMDGLKALYGEPVPRESVDNAAEGPQTYILDWVDESRAIAFQRNGEPEFIYWMRVEHIDPAFLSQR